MMQSEIIVRPLTAADHAWVNRRIIESWGAEITVAHGEIFHPVDLPGFIAEADGKMLGLLTYHIQEKACEIVTIDSWQEGHGIGSALIEAAKSIARGKNCRRLWLITTNDNIHALHFYQKRGFTLAGIHINAIHLSRQLKPSIPMTGHDGIPIRDEIELELQLE
jgi:N-acetylglutamate synthase-like GNAT family acetyltransferase